MAADNQTATKGRDVSRWLAPAGSGHQAEQQQGPDRLGGHAGGDAQQDEEGVPEGPDRNAPGRRHALVETGEDEGAADDHEGRHDPQGHDRIADGL